MKGIKLNIVTHQFVTRQGDFFVDDTDLQDETEILYANKGNFLEFPDLGVGITNFQNSPVSKPELERLIRKEFQKDNINVVSVAVKQQTDNDQFNITLKTSRNEEG
ncbi:MAG TPA: hypothetical protein VK658_08825 [Chryseolinea sp.]|nr:hypothetical protein [Chryseolinea sp.]